jgi:hypothetical protein
MYESLASWWPLLSAPADYEEEAAFFAEALSVAGGRPSRTVLELGSGGGNNASHLKARFDMVLVEPSQGMRRVDRHIEPIGVSDRPLDLIHRDLPKRAQ